MRRTKVNEAYAEEWKTASSIIIPPYQASGRTSVLAFSSRCGGLAAYSKSECDASGVRHSRLAALSHDEADATLYTPGALAIAGAAIVAQPRRLPEVCLAGG
jgi:hypothetical protein